MKDYPAELYAKEMERLGIDLSWKSSEIEGNTYTLLETVNLLKDKIEAKGKKREEEGQDRGQGQKARRGDHAP